MNVLLPQDMLQEDGYCGKQAYMVGRQYYQGDVISRWIDLYMICVQTISIIPNVRLILKDN